MSSWFLENSQSLVNSFGLLLDMLGVGLLFFFQIERNSHIIPDATQLVWTMGNESESDKSAATKKYNYYKRLTNLGLLLLISGFGFQGISNWL